MDWLCWWVKAQVSEELYGVYLVYWLWGRGYEAPCSFLKIGPCKKRQDL